MKMLKKPTPYISNCLIFFLSLFLLSFINTPAATAQKGSQQLKAVVLDAGHGGKDIGTPHYLLSKDEKDIALDIVLKLGKILKDSIPDLKVIYTRQSDVFIPLQERHEIANKANADLFISVHVNATAGTKKSRATQTSGTETYVLGLHRNPQKSRAIETYGENFVEETGLLDPNDPTTQILVAQYTQTFLSQSIDFASLVEQNMEKQGRESHGVRQMGLEVLAGSVMPGVLIETGFINNADDEKYLNSSIGQQQVAMSIYQAIKTYRTDLANKKGLTTSHNK